MADLFLNLLWLCGALFVLAGVLLAFRERAALTRPPLDPPDDL